MKEQDLEELKRMINTDDSVKVAFEPQVFEFADEVLLK